MKIIVPMTGRGSRLRPHSAMLQIKKNEGENLINTSAVIENSAIISPCFIGKNARIKNSTIGPGVSIG